MPTLTAMTFYPIKSCRGISLTEGHVGRRGFRYDRHWMVVEPDGMFVTQRERPSMALIVPYITDTGLVLNAPGMSEICVPLDRDGDQRRVEVWDSECIAVDDGAPIAAWLSDYLKLPVRLVRTGSAFKRPVNPRYAIRADDEVGFADGYPYLIISEESLADLNARLDSPLPMNRFRPNLVISGGGPFSEDTWRTIRIGGITFDLVKPCARCAITTTDQATAQRGKEPLRTLATYRDVHGKVMFGQNAIAAVTGTLRIGDPVEIVQTR